MPTTDSVPSLTPGHSIVAIGPSGAGKSWLLRSALEYHGAGVALLAPGEDEWDSYQDLLDDEQGPYVIEGFDDPRFLPNAGSWRADGQQELVKRLYQLYNANRKALESEGRLRYPVLCIDTWTGVDELCVNCGLAEAHLATMPKAISDKGGVVYGTLKVKHQEVMRIARANRGLGAHLLVGVHVIEKEAETALAEAGSQQVYMPAITGSFRDSFLKAFNLGLHVGVSNDPASRYRHYVQWVSDPKRLTKSRYRKRLSEQDTLPNEWSELYPLLEKARGNEVGRAGAASDESSSEPQEVEEVEAGES